MKIRGAILTTIGAEKPYARSRPLEIGELELDPPGRNEVLVRLHAAGLCHSDLSVIDGNRPRPVPMLLGHEAAGVVLEIGQGVDDLAVGDHVVAVFVPSCRSCAPCVTGRPALCEPAFASNSAGTLLHGDRRLHAAGKPVNHHLGVSAFASHAVLARESLVRIDKDLPLEQAALFGCAVITGVGAVINTAALPEGARVAVIGLGGVGLAALLGARLRNPRQLLAVDFAGPKLDLARKLGATATIDVSASEALEQLRQLTDGGVDFAFEMAGAVAALDFAWRATRRGGTTVTAGLNHPDARLSLSPLTLVAEERTLKGSYLGSCDPARDVPRYVDWFRQGRLPVDALMGETLGLEDLNGAFDRLASGQMLRQVVVL
ncbi:MAG: zinc-dependent alcohol dehydrogenase family protein [Steroidobacteraceae bacterium]